MRSAQHPNSPLTIAATFPGKPGQVPGFRVSGAGIVNRAAAL